MPILFYDHLVDYQEIHIHIDRHVAQDEHKARARQLVDDIVHHAVLDYILGAIPVTKHTTILSLFHDRPYDPEILIYIRQHTHDDIESDIRNHLSDLIRSIIDDIRHEDQTS
jgi:hypothetical protein